MNRQAVEGIKQLLEALGIDIKASDMEKTPERVATLFAHLFQGYGKDSKELWGEIFPTEYNGLVSVKGLPFYSMCEHHLMPFYGTADIVYQPKDGRVVGLGKLGKLVDLYARRPQLQERMTREIADAIERDLQADGVMVRLHGTHLCMLIKGELQQGTTVTTMECRGVLRESGSLRDEALAVLGGTDYVQTP